MVPESPRDAAKWFERGINVFEAATLDGLLTSAAADMIGSMSKALAAAFPRRRRARSGK